MESKRTATTYFIPPGKFLLMENALGNPDLIQSSVSSDCRVTIVDKANFPLDELEQWPTFRLVSADIQLKLGSGSYYIYIVVPTPDNEDTTTAFISYNTSLVDSDGYEVIASTDEDGNSVTSKGALLGKEGFKYYQCGVVSHRGGNSSATTNPEGQGRLIEVDLGVTPSPSTLPGDLNDFDEIFQLDKVDPSNPTSWLLSILTTVKTMVARMVRITGSLVFGQGENERVVTDVATSADKGNEQKIADDVLATTAWVDAQFEGFDGKYLRKDQDDRSTGTISSDKGMEVGHFIQGMLGGSGAKMYIDNNGKTIIEVDKAYFREEMLVPKITFNSIDVVSGEMAQTFAYGTIKSVDTITQIATLDLLDDEYGTLHAYDILRGTFHRLEGGNNTEYSLDKNGFHNYSGFSTSYFTPTEILVNEKGHMEFRYALQDADGMHPCAGMNFYAYGNFSDKDRQSVTYQTREYTRRLRNMDTWIINPSKNIAMQDGNLNNLEVGGFKMSGWGTFETNSYLMGTQIQFSPDQLEELKGLNGADAYSVTLSSYDGIIKVDAEGNITSGMTSTFNVTTGAMNVVTGDNNVVVTDFRLKTAVQASKGNTPLFYSTDMEEGSYMVFVASVGCDAEVNNGVVSVTEITDLKNASLTITVVCEGSHTVEQVYRINAVYDGTKPIIADIDNEMDSVACDSDGNVLFGLPVSCNVSMWVGSEELKIERISIDAPEGVTASVEGNKVTVSAITKEADKTLPIGITVTSSYGGKSYTKRLVFTINKIVAGENSLLYKLSPSVDVVKVSNTGEMSVNGVSCDVIAFDGKTTKKLEAPLPSDLSVKYSINGEDKGDYEYGKPVDVTKDDKEIEFKLYNKEVCIDIEGIPVVKDGDSSGIETIYSKLKEPSAPENVHPYVDNDVWSHEVHEDNIWMAVSTRKNNEWTDWQVSRVLGVSSFKSTAFIRTNNTPSTPTGGSYESPLPTDKDADGNLLWSDGIPEGESILWASVCTFHSNGHYPEDAKWSTPRPMTDTADFEAIYSPKEAHEEIPSGFFKDGVDLNPEWESAANAVGWYDDPNQWNVEGNEYKGKPTIWMATNTAKNGVWEGWKISRVLGEKGADAVSYEITPPSLYLRETLTGTVTPTATVFTCYASNKEERVETEATWGVKGRKDGEEDWTTFDYTHVGETMIFEPNQQNRYDEYLITATPKGQTTALEVQVVAIKDRRGVMPRYCGRWKEGTKYYYNDEVRDIVTLGGNVFQVYPYNPNGYVEAEPNPDLAEDSHDDYWEKANKFSFVAMDTALIDSAHIAGFTFWVDGQDAEGNPLGRMESANGEIVLDTLNETIKATNAVIEGSITAGSMSYKVRYGNGEDNVSLTGYGMASGTGSYILPDIEEGKTLQVRALCANYSNEFVKFAFSVPDGSSTKIYVKPDWSESWGEVDKVALGYNRLYTFTSAYDNIQNRWVWILTEGMGASGATQSLMIVDSEMSATSINPVQNKVIYEKFQSLGPFTYNKDLGYWTFNGDLLVQGGVTSHANEGKYTPSTIMDGVQVDGSTIIKDEYGNLAINPDIELGGGEVVEMTAKQILEKLVTIDGSGSSLDADKVDGFESSRMFVANRANMDAANLDTFELRNSGSVQVVNYSSSGTTINASPLYTFRSNGSYHGLEIYQQYNDAAPVYMIRSIKDTGSYTSWKTLAFLDSTVDKAKYATSAGRLSSTDSFTAWGKTFFSNGVPVSVSGNMTDVGNIIPLASKTYTLGSSVNLWNGIYLGTDSSYANNAYGVNFGDGESHISSGSGYLGLYANGNILFRTNGTTTAIGSGGCGMNLDASGNLLVTGGVTMYGSSDKRLKKNIRTFQAGKELMSLGGVYKFEYEDDEISRNAMYNGTHVGLMYQNVKGTILDKMCYEREDGYGALNYLDSSFISLLAGVGMEHETRIQELERENEELRKDIETIKKMLNGGI